MTEEIRLAELGFDFAVQQISPEIGTIRAFDVLWRSSDGQKDDQEITLSECITMYSQQFTSSYATERLQGSDTKYVCPDYSSSLVIQGDINARIYRYIKLQIEPCD